MSNDELFSSWAIVEIFGHVQCAGLVSEQTIAGQGFIRIDVPETPGRAAFTRLYGPSAIYSITPTTEDVARRFAARQVGAPVHVFQLAPTIVPTETEEQYTADAGDFDDDIEETGRTALF